MRTTLDIDDDILQAARELARKDGVTAGNVISVLARRGLSSPPARKEKDPRIRNGVPLLPSRGDLITLEHVRSLMEKEGI